MCLSQKVTHVFITQALCIMHSSAVSSITRLLAVCWLQTSSLRWIITPTACMLTNTFHLLWTVLVDIRPLKRVVGYYFIAKVVLWQLWLPLTSVLLALLMGILYLTNGHFPSQSKLWKCCFQCMRSMLWWWKVNLENIDLLAKKEIRKRTSHSAQHMVFLISKHVLSIAFNVLEGLSFADSCWMKYKCMNALLMKWTQVIWYSLRRQCLHCS